MDGQEIRDAIVSLVNERPGIASRDLSETLQIPRYLLSQHTCYLRDRLNLIENHGKDGRSFLWFPVGPEANDGLKYIKEARDFLRGFWKTSPAHRERFVAEFFEKLVEEAKAQ